MRQLTVSHPTPPSLMRCNHVTSDAQPGLLKRFSGGSYEENGPWLRGIGPICRISQRNGNPELARLSPAGAAKFALQDGVRAGELAHLRPQPCEEVGELWCARGGRIHAPVRPADHGGAPLAEAAAPVRRGDAGGHHITRAQATRLAGPALDERLPLHGGRRVDPPRVSALSSPALSFRR